MHNILFYASVMMSKCMMRLEEMINTRRRELWMKMVSGNSWILMRKMKKKKRKMKKMKMKTKKGRLKMIKTKVRKKEIIRNAKCNSFTYFMCDYRFKAGDFPFSVSKV